MFANFFYFKEISSFRVVSNQQRISWDRPKKPKLDLRMNQQSNREKKEKRRREKPKYSIKIEGVNREEKGKEKER